MGMIQKFWIEGRLPGMNEIIDAAKSRTRSGTPTYAHMKKVFTNYIYTVIRKSKLLKMVNAKISCTWVEPNKKRDKDNIAAGKKFIIDALVVSGVLKNDGWTEAVSFEDHFFVVGDDKKTGVLVVLEEVEPQKEKEVFVSGY